MTSLDTIHIDLGICTYRRAHIVDTLRSVAGLAIDSTWKLRIIVADNDDTPIAQQSIEAALKLTGFDYLYVHAPAHNISIARNACLDAANAKLFAFIDDDEIVSPQWLTEMMKALKETGADAVIGPVNAVYRQAAPQWMQRGNFHSASPIMEGERVVTGGSGNVLMRTDRPVIKDRRFRVNLGKSGGEDSEFFSAIYHAGGHVAFAKDALVTEEVPDNRATMPWLIKRHVRYGQTHAMLLLAFNASGLKARIRTILIAGSKASFSFLMALLALTKPDRMHFWLLRGALHSGVVIHMLNGRTIEIYGSKT